MVRPCRRGLPSIEGYDILRIRDGKILEAWIEQDMIGLLQQIGAVPEPV